MGYAIHHYDHNTGLNFNRHLRDLVRELKITDLKKILEDYEKRWNLEFPNFGGIFHDSNLARSFSNFKDIGSHLPNLFNVLPKGEDLTKEVNGLEKLPGIYSPALAKVMYLIGYETNVPAAINLARDLQQDEVREFSVKYGGLEGTEQLFKNLVTLTHFSGRRETPVKASRLSEYFNNFEDLNKVFQSILDSYEYPEGGRIDMLLDLAPKFRTNLNESSFVKKCKKEFSRKIH